MSFRIGVLLTVMVVLAPAGVASEDYPRELRDQWLPLATQGDPDAQYWMGRSQCCGYGAGYDTAAALRWFCAAAVQGHVDAQYALARQLAGRTTEWRRFGQSHFISEAYVWYRVAAEAGHTMAQEYARSLAQDLSNGALRRAQRRIDHWQEIDCRR